MSAIIYGLCAAAAAICAFMLLSGYRVQQYRLLLWSGLCFVGLTLNNLLLVLDKIIFPQVDLSVWRTAVALVAMMTLVYGLIWDVE
jgi:Family of unknown function (DUF5985)